MKRDELSQELVRSGPRELDLNIDSMRREASRTLIEALREGIKRFDDIDALERLLNAQTPRIARLAELQSNGNGGNGHHSISEVITTPRRKHRTRVDRSTDPAMLTVKGKLRTMAPRTNAAAIAKAAMPYVELHPGATLHELIPYLISVGVVPKQAKPASAEAAVRGALNTSKEFRAEKPHAGPGALAKWFIKPNTKPTTKPTTPKLRGPAAEPAHDAIVQALVTASTEHPQGMTRRQITEALIDSGFEFGAGRDPVQVTTWSLQALEKRHRIHKAGMGADALFTPIKPKLTVTKT